MAAVKKFALILDNAAIEEEFFDDAVLYGIRFPEDGYYTAWYLNNYVNTNFTRNHPFFLNNNQIFDMYEYTDANNNLEHYLYTNNKYGNYLVRELRGFHYFWLVKGEDNTYIHMNTFKEKLKALPHGFEMQLIQIDSITNKQVFIF